MALADPAWQGELPAGDGFPPLRAPRDSLSSVAGEASALGLAQHAEFAL